MAITVKINLLGQLRTIVNEPNPTLEVEDNTTVLGLFQILAQHFGQRFEEFALEMRRDSPAVQRDLVVFINNEKVEHEEMATTPVGAPGSASECKVFVMLPYTGG